MTLSQGLKKSFSQQHMLVDFEYLFCVNLLTLKFGTHIINIEMISWQENDFSALGKMSKLAVVKFFLTTTHVGRF